ncbi:MAG TPA: FtsX-like permease family protein, partial [Ktedonobacterales bacterium]|nr:FtsX-like permease family protein [Ktedonobacterales bacterium]
QRIYKINGVTRLVAYADSASDVSAVTSRISKALGSGVDVVSQAQIYTDTLNALRSAQTTIQTTLLISALTSALIIIFAVFLIVRERTQEIGLLRAIGASHWQIVSQFAIETLTLALTASVAAIALIALFAGTIARQFVISSGAPQRQGGRIFTRNGGGNFTPPAGGFGGFGGRFGSFANQTLSAGLTTTTVLLVIGLGIALAILASVIPVWYVARVRPAEALRTA